VPQRPRSDPPHDGSSRSARSCERRGR
jgi:hypothetical protein